MNFYEAITKNLYNKIKKSYIFDATLVTSTNFANQSSALQQSSLACFLKFDVYIKRVIFKEFFENLRAKLALSSRSKFAHKFLMKPWVNSGNEFINFVPAALKKLKFMYAVSMAT